MVSLVGLIGLAVDANAETGRYFAETHAKEAHEQGTVKAGGQTWSCKGNYCETMDMNPQGMAISSCAALAAKVGPLKYFGRKDKISSLDVAGLKTCNGDARRVSVPEPAKGGSEAEPLDEADAHVPESLRERDPPKGSNPQGQPPFEADVSTKATSFDLAIVDIRLTAKAAMFHKVEDTRVAAMVAVKSRHGLAPSFIVATTGDSTTPDRLIKSAVMRLGAGQSVDVLLELYINPAHTEDGVFRVFAWLGTEDTPLVYADANRANNIREIKFNVQPRPRTLDYRPPPRTIGTGSTGSDDDEGDGCDEDQVGQTCRVHPEDCSGRGKDWTIEGTYACVSGELRCDVQAQEDYCTSCGGVCGACANTTCCPGPDCSRQSLCAPGATCVDNRSIREQPFCQDLNVDFVARRTGTRVCTHIPSFCWTPDEVGMTHIICREAEGWEEKGQ